MQKEVVVETQQEAVIREYEQATKVGNVHIPGVVVQMFADKSRNSNKLEKWQADQIEALFNKYKKTKINIGDTIIEVEAGGYGHIEISQVGYIDNPNFVYPTEGGNYNYITIKKLMERKILWTDYQPIEPYNRQTPFYNGMSFRNMHLLRSTPYFREFYVCYEQKDVSKSGSCTFGMYGFNYNEYWDMVRFGIILKTKDVNAFMMQLRRILNKSLVDKDPLSDLERIMRTAVRRSKKLNVIKSLHPINYTKKYRSVNRIYKVEVSKPAIFSQPEFKNIV